MKLCKSAKFALKPIPRRAIEEVAKYLQQSESFPYPSGEQAAHIRPIPFDLARAFLDPISAYRPLKTLAESGLPIAFIGRSPWLLTAFFRGEGLPYHVSPLSYDILHLISRFPLEKQQILAARLISEINLFKQLVNQLNLKGPLTNKFYEMFGQDRSNWPVLLTDLFSGGGQYIDALGLTRIQGSSDFTYSLAHDFTRVPLYPSQNIPIALRYRYDPEIMVEGAEFPISLLHRPHFSLTGIPPSYNATFKEITGTGLLQFEWLPRPLEPRITISHPYTSVSDINFVGIDTSSRQNMVPAFEQLTTKTIPDILSILRSWGVEVPKYAPVGPYDFNQELVKRFANLSRNFTEAELKDAIQEMAKTIQFEHMPLSNIRLGDELIRYLESPEVPYTFKIFEQAWES